jgi:hypothetical protein
VRITTNLQSGELVSVDGTPEEIETILRRMNDMQWRREEQFGFASMRPRRERITPGPPPYREPVARSPFCAQDRMLPNGDIFIAGHPRFW